MRTIEEKIQEWEKESGIPLRLGEGAQGTWIDSFFYRGREIVVKAAEEVTDREIQLIRWGLQTALENEGGMSRHPLWTMVRGECDSLERKKWFADWELFESGLFRVAFFHFQTSLDPWHRESLLTLLQDEGAVVAGAGQEFLVLIQRDDWEQWLKDRQGTAEAEWMIPVLVTVGLPVVSTALATSYQDAKHLMQLLREDAAERRWLTYESAELSVLVHRLKAEEQEILRLRADNLNLADLEEEEWATAAVFWQHQLHLGQTAAALFIHRNTLNYRLERIRKKTGLDLHLVQDALRFQIAREVWEMDKRRQRGSDIDDTI